MAFNPLPSSWYEVGKAIRKILFQYIIDNQTDINDRLSDVEEAANKIEVFNLEVKNAARANTITGLTTWEAPSAFTLIDAKLGIYEKGVLTGTLEMDIKKGPDRNPSNLNSIFTVKPSINIGAAASYDSSINAAIDPGQVNVIAGEHFQFDITSLPSPIISKFRIFIIGEPV